MVKGLPRIVGVGKLYDGCLISKQKKSPFPREMSYHATKHLELMHGDLCRHIKPEMPGGRKMFLLLVNDMSRFMWSNYYGRGAMQQRQSSKFRLKQRLREGGIFVCYGRITEGTSHRAPSGSTVTASASSVS
jgi:hypothetical protein